MRKLFFLFVTLVATTTLWAYDFQSGDLYYYITSETTVAVTCQQYYSYDNYSFDNYSGLTTATIPETVTYNGTTYSVTSIGGYAFYYCSSLTSITIPNSVTSIGDYAFSGCSSLTSPVYNAHCFAYMPTSYIGAYVIPQGIKQIAGGAFEGCRSLTSVTIPNSATSIGERAFGGCSSLTSVTIPNSVTTMGGGVFSGCSSLESVFLLANITSILDYWYGGNECRYCVGFFEGCYSLTSITFPTSLTYISDLAFKSCSSLKSITIPDNVTGLGSGLFYGCSSLESVVFSKNLRYIDGNHTECGMGTTYNFFGNCTSLTEITMRSETPPTIYDDIFNDLSNYSVYVPCGTVTTYMTVEGWDNVQEPPAEYSINLSTSNSQMGSARVDYNTFCDDAQISAEPYYGYHFVQWSDGLTDNPRSLTLTQDTTFTAEFAQTFSGQCGDNLYWNYKNNTLTISGYGDMYDDCPWGLFAAEINDVVLPNAMTYIGGYAFYYCSSLTSVAIPNSVTSIGGNAFSSCSSLTSVTIPNSVTSIGYGAFEGCKKLGTVVLGDKIKEIGNYAFNECNKLYHIYCYASEPPVIEDNVFTNYNVNLYVPCNYLDNYKYDRVFGSFRYIQCMGADSENVPTDDVVVTPGTNDVTITWPIEGNADTYTIVIKKGNEVFCTLTFNADGQLLNIAFEPSRDGNNRPAQYAEQAGNGYRFTVTGLEAGTDYTYDITVKDASNQTINSHTGEFSTQSTTAVDNIPSPTTTCQKLLRDGQLLILRDGKTYTIMGQEL